MSLRGEFIYIVCGPLVIYLHICEHPFVSGTVLGAIVMQGFYVHFDRQNSRVGFANTTCAQRESHTASYVSGPYVYRGKWHCRLLYL